MQKARPAKTAIKNEWGNMKQTIAKFLRMLADQAGVNYERS
jgi:hypothetical protein